MDAIPDEGGDGVPGMNNRVIEQSNASTMLSTGNRVVIYIQKLEIRNLKDKLSGVCNSAAMSIEGMASLVIKRIRRLKRTK